MAVLVRALPGADDPSKLVLLRHHLRQAGVTECALEERLEQRLAQP